MCFQGHILILGLEQFILEASRIVSDVSKLSSWARLTLSKSSHEVFIRLADGCVRSVCCCFRPWSTRYKTLYGVISMPKGFCRAQKGL